MERELPLESMHALVESAARDGSTSITTLLRELTRAPRTRARGEAFFVAWQGGHLVGLAALLDDDTKRASRVARIHGLFVEPALRRRGIGSALIARAVRHAASAFVEVRLLDVDVRHAPFYRALGFTPDVARGAWSVRLGARTTT